MKHRLTLWLMGALFGFAANAATTPVYDPDEYDPNTYYSAAENLSGRALLSALHNIVGPHTNVGYDGLYTVYSKSDVTADGYVWDMYSTTKFRPVTDKCGNYKYVGDCYNREHGVPQSWFNKANPMKSDAFHVIPTDGKVNGQRSDYPYGECEGGTVLPEHDGNRSLCRLGACTFPGYTGTVFEPDNQYKGDIARSYFYMAAAYNDVIGSWSNGHGSLAGNSYPVFENWTKEMLLKWHREDPVSQKEIDRNEAIWGYQHNRNPFIDYPELAEYVWGANVGEGWVPGGASDVPLILNPADGYVLDLGVVHIGATLNGTLNVKGRNLAEPLSVSQSLDDHVITGQFTVSPDAIAADAVNSSAGANLSITYTSDQPADDHVVYYIGNDKVQVAVTIKAQAVDGIPALNATDITADGFTARWTNVDSDNATYLLYVTDTAGQPLNGYPVSVAARDGSYRVEGLEPLTAYQYYLASDAQHTYVSNTVYVTTQDVERELAIVAPAAGLVITTEPGAESPIIEASVYTENISDNITLEVEGNFQISPDKTVWLRQLTIDPDGETFYVRIADTSTEGNYTGLLSLSTPTFAGEDTEITGIVTAATPFVEDWEGTTSGGYWTNQVQGHACLWDFNNAGIWGSSSDRHHGALAARLGKNSNSSIAMAENKQGGAGVVSLYAGAFGTDEAAGMQLLVSTDDGTTWEQAAEFTAPAGTAQEFSFVVNVAGPVRIKLQQTSGSRVNLDDITISNYIQPSAVEEVSARMWDAVPARGGITLTATGRTGTIEVYNLRAARVARASLKPGATRTIALPAGIYVVSADGQAKKVVVK